VLAQLRNKQSWVPRVSEITEGNTEASEEKGEDVKAHRSHQAVACRKRYVEEPGKARVAPYRRGERGIQLLRHGRGNPETELSWNPVFMAVTAVTQDIRIFRHEGETWKQGYAGVMCCGNQVTGKVGGKTL
jgi:hypothetical protein